MQSKNLLIADVTARWVVAASLGITLAIFYWLIELRQNALDITFEGIFNGLFMFYDYPLVVASVLIVLLALLPQARQAALHAARGIGDHIHLVAAVYFVVLAGGAFFMYHAHPLSMDEYSAVFQSKIFAAGELTGSLPPSLIDWLIPKGFQNYFLSVSHADGRVVSSYWPAFALLLAPFAWLGAPWLCNPLLGALTVLSVHRLALMLFDDRTSAGLAAALTLAAPAVAINGMSFYSMTAHLLANCLFVMLLLRPSVARAFGAGVVGSIALCLHNPIPHVLFATPWLLWFVSQRERRRYVPAIVAGYLPLSLLLGVGWALLVRDVSTAVGADAASGGPLATGRVSEVFRIPVPGLLYARLVGLAKLWTWAVPASLVVAVIGLRRQRESSPIRLLAWSALLTFVGYLFVPFDQGHGWGFRYFHAAWMVIPLFAAAAVTTPQARHAAANDGMGFDGLAGYMAACALFALLVLIPLSAIQVEEFISRHLQQQPSVESPGVLILKPGSGYYAYDLVQNDPFLRDPVIRMATRGKKKDEAMMAENFPRLQVISVGVQGSVWGRQVGRE